MFCPQSSFVCVVQISEQTAIIFLKTATGFYNGGACLQRGKD